MLSLAWSTLLSWLALPLSWLVRRLRRWQLGRSGVLALSLSHDLPRRAPLEGIAATAALLRAMGEDPLLRAVRLHLRSPSLGWAAAQDLHQALLALRARGKLVFVHLEHAGNQELLLASAADRAWLAPAGEVFLTGVDAWLVFAGDLLGRLGVRVEIEAAGAYKSFGETYARAFPSPANRLATAALVEDLGAQLVETLASARKVPEERVRALLRRCPVPPEEALAAGLIDGVGHADQADAALEAQLGRSLRPVAFHRYARLLALERALARVGRRGRVVSVVHLEGPVVHGAEPSGGGGHRIDADRVVPVLDQLREAEQVGAAVLFVNSPGGSALASDVIARAVERLAQAKPVVAVFANVAASGGYYVAAPCAEIVAQPGSITGSIGVVGGKLAIGGAAGQVGVHAEVVRSDEQAMMLSAWRPFRPEERARFRALLDRTYDRFLAVVAAGRKRPVQDIADHAQGRVWTGRQALERGLVDRLGGLDEGLSRARALAGLPSDAAVVHQRFPPPRFRLLAQLLGRDARAAAPGPDLLDQGLASLGEAGGRLSLLRHLPGQALALLPWVVSDP
ncbi:signal peptide peptidase SppA [Myxococcota bacterium]|nr:signal peptide peptidase SppA [Myxococcota bacterium]